MRVQYKYDYKTHLRETKCEGIPKTAKQLQYKQYKFLYLSKPLYYSYLIPLTPTNYRTIVIREPTNIADSLDK